MYPTIKRKNRAKELIKSRNCEIDLNCVPKDSG
jgi:hypothetical protein